ncbi:glycosyltransferase family 2 protein [Sulfuricurvum sp.]|uniref:glycosyltransferase family 2 protein n=1 Tax=Sulfuricurvum sp. TaxID=2025608 RepID=UPI00261BB3A3|nr:glycosyltransferase family 2 protein [Sulfuricurvum sp.]MDD2781548.1 glycosyltransferase [Sulfuricurvum sp.]
MKRISAVICTYNRYDVLEKAIKSLEQQTLLPSDFEILVIDNSPDFVRSEEVGKTYTHISNLKYVIEKTPGLSNARNVATNLAQSPFVAFLDDDAIAIPEWLEKILVAVEQFGEDVDVIGGRIDPIWAKPRPSWLGDELLGNVSVVNWGGECRIASSEEWFAGANITFRVVALKENGGFAVNLGRKGSGATLLSNEESDLIEKIRASGKKLVYQPEARVDHLVEEKRLEQSWFRRRAAWQATSDFLMKPEEQVKYLKSDWENLIAYVNNMEPQNRNIRALQVETDNPGVFRWQLSAIYTITRLALAGFDGLEE